MDIELSLLLSQVLMCLKSHRDPTKGLFVMIQHDYDDELVILLHMVEVSLEVAAISPILLLVLEGRLGINVSRFFHSSYTIGTEGYQWVSTLDKVVPTGVNNALEEIVRQLIHHTDDFTMQYKHYKEEDHGGYVINIGSFDITGAL